MNKSDPVWTAESVKRGNTIVDVFCDETKLVTLESGISPASTTLVIYDFWHNKNKNNYMLKSKRCLGNNSSSKKRLCY